LGRQQQQHEALRKQLARQLVPAAAAAADGVVGFVANSGAPGLLPVAKKTIHNTVSTIHTIC
jgi:hypothetical protein